MRTCRLHTRSHWWRARYLVAQASNADVCAEAFMMAAVGRAPMQVKEPHTLSHWRRMWLLRACCIVHTHSTAAEGARWRVPATEKAPLGVAQQLDSLRRAV
eukprot:7212563-Prymnesium_polylepis.2